MKNDDTNLSDSLFQRSLKVAPGGVHSPVRSFKGLGRTPIFFKEAQGALLKSVEGKNYIDYCQSFGPLLLGHLDPEVKEGVHSMIDKAWSFGACEPYSLELAEWMTQNIPWIGKLRFVSSGTEAVMSALRVARAATGRSKILKFEGCYHGHVDSLLVKSGSGLAGVSASSSAGVYQAVSGETLVLSLDDTEGLKNLFSQQGKEIAAVIIEPLPANYGLLIQRKEYLQSIAALCKSHGTLLIFDEVISGFRVAKGGMAEVLELTPDLVTYGKIIGGGFPVGCYGGRKELMDLVAPLGPVYQAGTLSANPVGMKAGLLTLQKASRENVWLELEKRGAYFEKNLNSVLAESQSELKLTRYTSLFWLHLASADNKTIRRIDQISPEQSKSFLRLFEGLLAVGIYLAPNAYEVGFLSFAHSQKLIDQTIEGFQQVLKRK